MNSEPTIAGKTHSEIMSMEKQRWRWYKTISKEEKEEAMKIVEIARRAKQSDSIMGEDNPMYGKSRPHHSERMRGMNNPAKRPDVRAKLRMSWTPKRKNERSNANMGENNPMYGKTQTEESNIKRRVWWTPKRRGERSAVMSDRVVSEEVKDKIRESMTGKIHTEKTKAKISVSLTGHTTSKKTRAKISAANTGDKNPNFNDWASRAPYCYKWNDERKEHIRNLCDRTCSICGESALQYFRIGSKTWMRLHIDHLDENKMQGCDDWEWRLTALCPSCHGKMQKQEVSWHLLLRLLLLNNKRHQTNFLFGDMEEITYEI